MILIKGCRPLTGGDADSVRTFATDDYEILSTTSLAPCFIANFLALLRISERAAASRGSWVPNIISDALRLCGPSSLVHAKRSLASVCGHTVEARFHNREESSLHGLHQPKFHQRRGLRFRINVSVYTVGNPTKAEVLLRLDALHCTEDQAFIGQFDL